MVSNVALLDFNTPELIIILAIVLLLFGGKKLPELSRSLGDSMRELRKGLNDNVHHEQKAEAKTETNSNENSVN